MVTTFPGDCACWLEDDVPCRITQIEDRPAPTSVVEGAPGDIADAFVGVTRERKCLVIRCEGIGVGPLSILVRDVFFHLCGDRPSHADVRPAKEVDDMRPGRGETHADLHDANHEAQ